MNQLFCPFRSNVRLENGSETADCAFVGQQLGIPGLPVVVDRNTCEVCCASSRSMGLSNPVLSSLLCGACDEALALGNVPADQRLHIQSLYEQSVIQLQHFGQVERTYSCDVFLCCTASDPATRRTIESLLDPEDAVAIVHLIDDCMHPDSVCLSLTPHLLGTYADEVRLCKVRELIVLITLAASELDAITNSSPSSPSSTGTSDASLATVRGFIAVRIAIRC